MFQHKKTSQKMFTLTVSLASFLPKSLWQQRANTCHKRHDAVLCSDRLVESSEILCPDSQLRPGCQLQGRHTLTTRKQRDAAFRRRCPHLRSSAGCFFRGFSHTTAPAQVLSKIAALPLSASSHRVTSSQPVDQFQRLLSSEGKSRLSDRVKGREGAAG